MVTVFLSGAIDHVGDFAKKWRDVADDMLQKRGYSVYDPTKISESGHISPEEIAQKNLFMQKRSDVLLVEYVIENRPYIGTDFEMAWAKLHGQPIVVICNNDNAERVYMKYLATKIVPSLDEAIEYISVHYPSYGK
jgi:hypothetical protein